jgi:SpoIID/LytB domain protein
VLSRDYAPRDPYKDEVLADSVWMLPRFNIDYDSLRLARESARQNPLPPLQAAKPDFPPLKQADSYGHLAHAWAHHQPRILLMDQTSHVEIQGTAPVIVREATATGWNILGRFRGVARVVMQGNQLVIHTPEGNWRSNQSIHFSALDPAFPLRVNKSPYSGVLHIHRENGKMLVVNELPMEEYLRGVVPHEIGYLDSTGTEAIKAQAIAARTYAYRNLKPTRLFDLHTDVKDQVYKGLTGTYPLADRAIIATKGIVLVYEGKFAETYYHSTCGGYTTAVHHVWNKDSIAYLVSVPDLDENHNPWCQASSFTTWSYEWSWNQIQQLAATSLNQASPSPPYSGGTITHLSIVSRAASGRVRHLDVHYGRGASRIFGDRVRWFLRRPDANQGILPSTYFRLNTDSKGVRVTGRGLGHGIGMCQMGARGRSRAGQNYGEILSAYYKGTQLVRLIAPEEEI